MRKTARDVINEVAKRHGLGYADMMSIHRGHRISHPRQEAMFECYVQCPHLSYPAIARAFGGMDHTTVIHGIKKHCERIGVTYASVRRTTAYYKATEERNCRIGFIPHSAAEYRQMARL